MSKVIPLPTSNQEKPFHPRNGQWPFEKLIQLCLKNDPAAWEKFIQRFESDIVRGVERSLSSHKMGYLAEDPQIMQSIIGEFIEKLIKGRVLERLQSPYALSEVVNQAVMSVTVDWIRKENRQKDVLRDYQRGNVVSIHEPVNPGSELTVGETIGKYDFEENESSKEKERELDAIFRAIETLKPEERLVIKTVFILYDPLSDDDEKAIANKRSISVEEVRNEADSILIHMLRKNEKRIKAESTAVVLWERIRKLEAILRELRKDPDAGSREIRILEEEIAKKSAARERKLKESRSPVRPSNEEIAHLLALPTDKVKQISLRILRIREKLRKLTERG